MQKVVRRMVTITEEERRGYLELIRERNEMYFNSLQEQRYEEAREEGLKEGIEKGRAEGMEKGIEKGREEGREKVIEIIKNLALKNKSAEEIADLLGIELAFIKQVIKG